jgi:LacI family transcriptional regulator
LLCLVWGWQKREQEMAKYPATLLEIAKALGTSIGTVHRALHNNPGVSPATRARVLQMARALRYKPNLAARYLSSKRTLRISVNTLRGTTSFWDEVRAGIQEEAGAILLENVQIEFRTYPNVGEGEEQAFEAALRDKVNGIITFPSNPQTLRPWIRRASQLSIPVVCVATDAPQSGRLGIVAIDTLASGSIAADLMGRFLGEREGPVAVTLFDMAITEHAEKYAAFDSTLRSLYPKLRLLKPIEDNGMEAQAYSKCCKLFAEHPNLCGVYVTTEDSIPVLKAAGDAKLLPSLTIITTDLFPDLVPYIRCGAVAATIYQRPRAQGRRAFRMLHSFLADGSSRSHQVTLAPHLVMRGNLDFFLQRQSQESVREEAPQFRGKGPRDQ